MAPLEVRFDTINGTTRPLQTLPNLRQAVQMALSEAIAHTTARPEVFEVEYTLKSQSQHKSLFLRKAVAICEQSGYG